MHLIGVGLQGINTFCDLDLSQGLATNVYTNVYYIYYACLENTRLPVKQFLILSY